MTALWGAIDQREAANEDSVITEAPTVLAPDAEVLAATESALSATFEASEDVSEIAMGDYPEYWIG
jgi:hypothetical protein